MLHSEIKERSRRFRLALRMGVPILLLIGAVVVYLLRRETFAPDALDIALFALILFVSVYFLFFLINMGQSETYIDRMTGAFNRRALFENLRHAMRSGGSHALLLLRVDNLPAINDHYGIDRGDRLLRVLVHLLDDFLRLEGIEKPIIGRYHGGDFIVGLPLGASRAQALLESFASTYKEIGNIAVELRFAAVEAEGGEDLQKVVTHLYDTISQPEESKKSRSRTPTHRTDIGRLEEKIVDAVHAGRLKLHYVPALNLRNGRNDLFEVGVRLEIGDEEILPPKKFIPVVNRLGLERDYDEALFEAVCRDVARTDGSLRFSFNISPFSLRNEKFVETIEKIASKEGVAYRRLILELFENRPVKDTARYRVVLEELRELGVRFALDNFGAPNASFEYIKKLPVDMVQFDREFTISYNKPRIAALLEGYLRACRRMEVETLLKWVDTAEALERFRELGVDYVQGFIVSDRPLCGEELIERYGVKP
ncbi:EAL domain-containing protein [Hydrogenimonas sp.]